MEDVSIHNVSGNVMCRLCLIAHKNINSIKQEHKAKSKAKRLDLYFLFICTEYKLNIRGAGVIANSKSTSAVTNSIAIDSVILLVSTPEY